MKRITRLVIAVGLLILFLSCSQNRQNAAIVLSPAQQLPPTSQKTDAGPFQAEYRKISVEVAKKMLDSNPDAILLDVRNEAEYKEKHIKGAVLLPLPAIEKKAEEVLPDKNAVILIYCRSGVRSKNAANLLVLKEYTQVYDLGGINGWPYDTE